MAALRGTSAVPSGPPVLRRPTHAALRPLRRADGSESHGTGEDNGIGDFHFGQVLPINRTTIIGTTDYYTDESTEQEALHSYDSTTPAAAGTGGTTCRRI